MKPTKPKKAEAIAGQSEKPVSTAPEREKDGVLAVAVRASTGGRLDHADVVIRAYWLFRR